MLAAANFLFLAFEVAAYLALGRWLANAVPLGAGQTLLLLVGFALTLRLLLTGLGFRLARHFSTEPAQAWKLPPGRWVALVAGEWLAMSALWTVLHPLEKLVNRRDARLGAAGPPVLLVHGLACNGASWLWLKRRLAACGFTNLYTLNLEPVLGSIDRYGPPLARRMDEVLARTGAPKVFLVAHSMGGLASRVYLQQHGGGAKVAGLVTIGTPHHGTALARHGVGVNVRQMQVGSRWLAELNRDEHRPAPVPMLSVYSAHDNLVSPQAGSRLACAENRRLTGIGHVAMFFSPRVADEVVAFLRRLSQTEVQLRDRDPRVGVRDAMPR